MEFREKLVQLSQKLVLAEGRIDSSQLDYEIWYSLWLDMVGALYSFYKAVPLLRTGHRNYSEMIAGATKILELIQLDSKIEDNNPDAWFDGYYLNNAEFRISLALHCLLKACYPCNRDHKNNHVGVPKLIKKICEKEECQGNKRCYEPPIPLNKRCTKILTDFSSYHNQRKSNNRQKPNNTGHYLVAIHFRVNSLKHTPGPPEDLMQPNVRMYEALNGLLGIYELFRHVAQQRGALRK